jgi:hypothetical protein
MIVVFLSTKGYAQETERDIPVFWQIAAQKPEKTTTPTGKELKQLELAFRGTVANGFVLFPPEMQVKGKGSAIRVEFNLNEQRGVVPVDSFCLTADSILLENQETKLKTRVFDGIVLIQKQFEITSDTILISGSLICTYLNENTAIIDEYSFPFKFVNILNLSEEGMAPALPPKRIGFKP